MCYGKIDFTKINTDPGGRSTFAPPVGWEGDYVQYLRDRWKFDPGLRQHVGIVGRSLQRGDNVEFSGRYATEALMVVKSTLT